MVDQVVSALKFLYIELYKRHTPADFCITRPRREFTLPRVLNRTEVLALADAVPNRRHRLAVLLLYAAGLRVSELVAANVGESIWRRCPSTSAAGRAVGIASPC